MPWHSPTSGWDRSYAQVLWLPEDGEEHKGHPRALPEARRGGQGGGEGGLVG